MGVLNLRRELSKAQIQNKIHVKGVEIFIIMVSFVESLKKSAKSLFVGSFFQ